MKKNTFSLLIAAVLLLTTSPAFSSDHNHKDKKGPKTKATTITVEEVNAAQQAWCDAVVDIGKAYDEGGDYKKLAMDILTQAYDYDNGTVFFKPTLAFGDQTFRTTKEGAHSYFVGGNSKYPNDKGFALKPWVKVWYDNLGDGNEGIQIFGNIAITMGNVYFTGKDGSQVMVDKTFVFKKGDDGVVRLIVHKSSLPYTPSN